MRACPYTCVLAHVCVRARVRAGMHARARVYVCVCARALACEFV